MTVCALAGVLAMASQSSADTFRYRLNGDWNTVFTASEGWGPNPNNPGVPGGRVPIANDEARVNFGGSTVTVTTVTPTPGPKVQIGVDENGIVVVESGGVLTGNDVYAGHNNANATGTLTVNNGGIVNVSNILWAANNGSDGVININSGSVVNVASHLWWGVSGTATINVSGSLNQTGGILGLGTSNASTPGGGTATVNIGDGGLLALNNISSAPGTPSIQPGSVIDITGTGQLTLPGSFVSVLQTYVDSGLIVGDGVVGDVAIDLTTNPGYTTVLVGSGPTNPPASSLVLSVQDLGNGTLELAWPMGFGAFVVETTTNDLAGPGPWDVLQAPVTLANSHYTQIVSKDAAQAFYRLATAPTDNTTLSNKSMMGYQGWFSAPGDTSLINDRWHHWGGGLPLITDWGIDFYPDMSEYAADERFEPGWVLNNGQTAYLYSAAHPKSVERHCQWMWDYQIDGVFLQRFLGEVQDSRFFSFRNSVTQNIRNGAEKYSRLYSVMYDVSGVADANMLGWITNDWNYLVGTLDVTNSPSYARHNGKPVVSIWGLGFKDRGLTTATATAIINYFKAQGMTVKGGVPDGWRNLTGASETDPAWAAVYRSFDIISPWTVGRYSNLTQIDNWRVNKIVPDLAEATAAGADYMPVIFPGFSWFNIHAGPVNQIPRLAGDFYWRQVYNIKLSGCSMLYTAMFDEVDEGTAMYKMAETSNDLPAGATMVPLDVDGTSLPSDWYLQVGGEAGRMLRGDIPLQSTLPISP